MIQTQQTISHSGQRQLLIAQLGVMLPFAVIMPFWLLPVITVTTFWRLRVMRGHSAEPSWVLKLLFAIVGIASIALIGIPFPSLDIMVALLLLGYALKSLEVQTQRDGLVVNLLGYFLLATGFLYHQGILAGLYGLVVFWWLTATMMAIQFPMSVMAPKQRRSHQLKTAALMMAQSLPLMLILFLFAPRIAPLFSLPMSGLQGTTGISNSMSPGDIANLSKSDALAFRVTFEGEAPPQHELYWRGLTLSHFDGHQWRQFEYAEDAVSAQEQLRSDYRLPDYDQHIAGKKYRYEAVYEATGRPWLFTLTPSRVSEGEVFNTFDYRIVAKNPLHQPLLLNLESAPQSPRGQILAHHIRSMSLQLPFQQNPETKALSDRLLADSENSEDYIGKVLDHFRHDGFAYTLKPDVLSRTNSIDEFLFQSKRGFCSHYAGSFVVLMRMAGIPARIVSGYQGGEWHEEGQFMQIRQYDAHAWAEVWLPEKGWIRIDPTVMVAPERIEQNMEAQLDHIPGYNRSAMQSLKSFSLFKSVRNKLDGLQYGWRRFVLGYDSDLQTNLFETLFGVFTIKKVLLLLLGLVSVVGLSWVIILGLSRQRRQEAEHHRLYRKFVKRLETLGVPQHKTMTPKQLGLKASKQLPAMRDSIQHFIRDYQAISYTLAGDANKKQLIKKLKRNLNSLDSIEVMILQLKQFISRKPRKNPAS